MFELLQALEPLIFRDEDDSVQNPTQECSKTVNTHVLVDPSLFQIDFFANLC